jgi:hypothetical protein
MNPRTKFRAALLLAILPAAPVIAQSPEYSGPASIVIITPPITIYGQRVNADELIALEVVDRLASDPRLSGTIGVEAENREVTLIGLVNTPGQVERAGLDAHVDGVRAVHNYLRSKLEL